MTRRTVYDCDICGKCDDMGYKLRVSWVGDPADRGVEDRIKLLDGQHLCGECKSKLVEFLSNKITRFILKGRVGGE